MQRTEPEGVVISCDFCGDDWDEIKPMIEGHHGSVVCLSCLRRALDEQRAGEGRYSCTMCLRDPLPAELPRWTHPERPASANPQATICAECVEQAARAFDRDPDVDWSWER